MAEGIVVAATWERPPNPPPRQAPGCPPRGAWAPPGPLRAPPAPTSPPGTTQRNRGAQAPSAPSRPRAGKRAALMKFSNSKHLSGGGQGGGGGAWEGGLHQARSGLPGGDAGQGRSPCPARGPPCGQRVPVSSLCPERPVESSLTLSSSSGLADRPCVCPSVCLPGKGRHTHLQSRPWQGGGCELPFFCPFLLVFSLFTFSHRPLGLA